MRLTEIGHNLIKGHLKESDTILDATLGNGYDSLFLVSKVKRVIAFDIQDVAIKKSKELLKDFNNIEYIKDSHANIDKYDYKFDGAIFNLGYLPGGDKKIQTQKDSTMKALNYLVRQKPLRFILITVYPKSNKEEANAVLDFFVKLDENITIYNDMDNPDSPIVIFFLNKVL